MEAQETQDLPINPVASSMVDRLLVSLPGGLPEWYDQNQPYEQRLDSFVGTHLGAGSTPEQVHRSARRHFPGANASDIERMYGESVRERQNEARLQYERQQAAGQDESPIHYGLSRLPFASIMAIPRDIEYARAQQRYRSGQATEEDLRRIAQMERLQQIQQERTSTTGGRVLDELTHAPGMVGEFAIGGGLLGRAGAFVGPAAAGRSLLGRTAGLAASTAATPSLYLPQVAERNREEGRDPYNIRGFPAAFTMGMLQNAIFGSLGTMANGVAGQGLRNRAQRVLTGIAVGLGAQHFAVEPISEMVSDFLPHAYRLNTGDGLLSNAFQGKWGEAWQQFAVSLTTMAAFSAMHELGRKPLESARDAMQELRREGMSRDEVVNEMRRLTDLNGPNWRGEQPRHEVPEAEVVGQRRPGERETQGPAVTRYVEDMRSLKQIADKSIQDAEVVGSRPPVKAPEGERANPNQRWNDTGTIFKPDEAGRPSLTTKSGQRYSLEVEADAKGGIVMVRDRQGKVIKDTYYGFTRNADGSYSGDVKVAQQHQGQGLQKAMYDWVSRNLGPVAPQAKGFGQTDAGRSFWAKNAERGLEGPAARVDRLRQANSGIQAAPRANPAEAVKQAQKIAAETRLEAQKAANERLKVAGQLREKTNQVHGEALEIADRAGKGEKPTAVEQTKVNKAFGLSEKEATVFWDRWSSAPEARRKTHEEIGKEMGLTRARVQQIEAVANAKAERARSAFAEHMAQKQTAAQTKEGAGRTEAYKGGFHELPKTEKAAHEAISDREDAYHDRVVAQLEDMVKNGQPVTQEAANAIMTSLTQEFNNARAGLSQGSEHVTPPIRREAEQAVQSGLQDAINSIASPKIERPSGTEQAPAGAEVPNPELAGAGGPAPGTTPTGRVPVEGSVPAPSARELLTGEAGTFDIDQFKKNVAQLARNTHDLVLDRLAPVLRVVKEGLKLGYNPGRGRDAETVLSGLAHADAPLANEFRQKGIWILSKGQKVTIGKPLEEILKPLAANPKDMEPIKGGMLTLAGHWFEKPEQVTRFDVFATARSIVDERTRNFPGMVSTKWYHEAVDVLNRFNADPAFVARASAVHDSLILNIYNASLLARAAPEVHNITPADAHHYITKHPKYVEARRGLEEDEFKTYGQGRGREGMGGKIHAREGSERPLVPPLVTANERLDSTARIVNEQLRRNAIEDLLATQGLEHWSEKMPPGTKPDPREAQWHWNSPTGEVQTRKIKDKALYELLSGTQGADNAVVRMYQALGEIELGTGVKLIPAITQMIKTGATGLSMGFQFRNLLRDAFTFFQNTENRPSFTELPKMLVRMYWAELQVLFGKVPNDVIFQTVKEFRGEQMKMLSFDIKQTSGIPKMQGPLDFMKQVLRVLGAGELGPRALEMKNALERQGWTEKKLAMEREKARAAAAASPTGNYREPLPFYEGLEVSKAGREVTVDFGRSGVLTGEINKTTPFFGPAVSGIFKALKNWKVNTRGAAMALAGYLGLKLAHWLAYHDEEWYPEQSAYDRYLNFVIPFNGKLYRFPGARDLEVATSGAMLAVLDWMADNRPDWVGFLKESAGAISPPAPLPAIFTIPLQVVANRDWMGRPIVPRSEENLPASHNLTNRQIPYVLQQLTGGRGEISMRGLTGLNAEVRSATRSLNEFYDELHTLQQARNLARRNGQTFPQEARYQQLHTLEPEMRQLQKDARQSPERADELRLDQNRRARRVLTGR